METRGETNPLRIDMLIGSRCFIICGKPPPDQF